VFSVLVYYDPSKINSQCALMYVVINEEFAVQHLPLTAVSIIIGVYSMSYLSG